MLLLLATLASATADDAVTCKHGFPGRTVLEWHSHERLTAEEYTRAQRAGRAVDPVPLHGVVTAIIHRRPSLHAHGENFDWVFVADGEVLHREHGAPTVARPPPPPYNNRDWPWRTDNAVTVPAGLPDVFEVHLVDQLLDDSCAIRVVRPRGRVKRWRRVLD
ncbi:MAG: hypothetical protein ACI8PZ_002511 [Myxococcota bacterium]|jgi:hypothetical protein